MLYITIPETTLWDDNAQIFIPVKRHVLQLEHSLISISKWESQWLKPFLGKEEKTNQELLSYIKYMTITQNVPDEVYLCLTDANYKVINDYIEAPMTAKHFNNKRKGPLNQETITSELLYYWMIALNIPSQYEKWHLNRLLALIRVCNEKNEPPKKRSANEVLQQNADLNAARKKALNTSG